MASKIHQKSLLGAPWAQKGAKYVQKSLQAPVSMVLGSIVAPFWTDVGRFWEDLGATFDRFNDQFWLRSQPIFKQGKLGNPQFWMDVGCALQLFYIIYTAFSNQLEFIWDGCWRMSVEIWIVF